MRPVGVGQDDAHRKAIEGCRQHVTLERAGVQQIRDHHGAADMRAEKPQHRQFLLSKRGPVTVALNRQCAKLAYRFFEHDQGGIAHAERYRGPLVKTGVLVGLLAKKSERRIGLAGLHVPDGGH